MQTGRQRKAWFLTLFYEAQDASVSLFDLIKGEIKRSVRDDANGPITATSGNGRSVAFTIPDQSKFETAADRQNNFVLLHDLFKDASECLGLPFPPTDNTNDTAIFGEMIKSKYFDTIHCSFPDWTRFRLPRTRCGEGVLTW